MQLKKHKWGINRKALAAIIVFTLLINASMCVCGSYIFDRVIQRIYNERGYVVANIILKQIDHDKIAEYSKTWKADDYYDLMVDYLKYIQECSDAAYIYIGVPYEDKTIKYIYDSGSEIGFVDPIAASFDEVWNSFKNGKRPDSYLVRHSKYGFLTSSCLPVIDSMGNVVALLFVDTNMEIIQSTILKYLLNMCIVATFLLAIFCVLHWNYMNQNLIKPIMLIRKNVKQFSEDTSSIDNSLSTITTRDEVEDLAMAIGKMEKTIVEYIEDIKNITAEKERISAELNVATQIQADMLPSIFPPFPNRKEFDIFATMTPAKEVGGDFYDFFLIDDDHIALVMADVSGKGVPAALFMVIAKTLIKNRTLMGGELSPAQILMDVNDQLCENNKSDLFVTVWFAIIEISTGKGIAANAGHEHPVLKRKGGVFELQKYKHSPAVATMEGIRFREHEFILYPGDELFVYTDGVPEATNKENELFGDERLLYAMNNNPDVSAKEILGCVKNSIDDFVKDAPQFDDITMMCFVYSGDN
ncbi:SpoIIE family protein phosphatase [Butyrivibrio sp. NC3005]|uniref:SpoIIE family protein phosphatase n=1 Tax=Butyrivibrio sp. NC3005 TaxID=1280685 RepID=UPI0003F8B727|nr:PP2C family protein-serine/threonine phosphatase [Butyrivibrio sp. NC3005]